MSEGLIYRKMANVYAKIEAIGKNQTNKEQKYVFRGIDDVYNALHKIFAEEGIFVAPEKLSAERTEVTSKSGTTGYRTISTIKFTFFAEDGSNIPVTADGESIDYGDKSTSKSQSMAIKYALLQTFMIPTEDTEDGDKTSPEAGKTKSNVTPAVLQEEPKKNAAGEIELKKGDQKDFLNRISKCKSEDHLTAYYKMRAKFIWTAEEIKAQEDMVSLMREQWKSEDKALEGVM